MLQVVQKLEDGNSIFDDSDDEQEEAVAAKAEVVDGPWGDIPKASAAAATISFDRQTIINKWAQGDWPNHVYVDMALMYDMAHFSTQDERNNAIKSIDVAIFCERWAGPEDEKGKRKTLNEKQFYGAIAKLSETSVKLPQDIVINYYG